MKAITELTGTAVPYLVDNVDTDQIIPARFLFRSRAKGFSDVLFHDIRFDANGHPQDDFILNDPIYSNVRFLVGGQNFGCGSSREHAVWALLDYGIRCVIAPSFGDIFFNNALKNGLLTLVLGQPSYTELVGRTYKRPLKPLHLNLPSQTLEIPSGLKFTFSIDPVIKNRLIKGLGDIDVTLDYKNKIERFEKEYEESFYWLFPQSHQS